MSTTRTLNDVINKKLSSDELKALILKSLDDCKSELLSNRFKSCPYPILNDEIRFRLLRIVNLIDTNIAE